MLIGARSFDDSAAPAARVMNNRCMNNDEGSKKSHVLNCMVNTQGVGSSLEVERPWGVVFRGRAAADSVSAENYSAQLPRNCVSLH